jgi:hypothetical protein
MGREIETLQGIAWLLKTLDFKGLNTFTHMPLYAPTYLHTYITVTVTVLKD